MRWLFWILLTLALAIGVSMVLGNNEGYVLIVRQPYRLELSLNFLLILIVLMFASLHLMLRLVHYIQRLPASVRTYKEGKRLKDGHAALLTSLHAITEGHYAAAEKSAARALELGEDPALSALIAARASHKMHQKGQRDYYLAEAERLAPHAAVARLLTQAELLMDDRQYMHALEVLHRLEKIEPRHVGAMLLELKVQLRLEQWEKVLSVLQQLERCEGIASWQAREYRQQAYLQILNRYVSDPQGLLAYWKAIPEEDRLSARLAQVGANSFNAIGNGDQAYEIVAMSLTKQWDTELAGMIGDCASSKATEQLQQAENWLLSHEGDANLLLSLGKLCIRLSLWGKAQSYLEASISVKPTATAHLMLAKMLEGRGETNDAFKHYRLSVQFCQQA
jgi:HemY protein